MPAFRELLHEPPAERGEVLAATAGDEAVVDDHLTVFRQKRRASGGSGPLMQIATGQGFDLGNDYANVSALVAMIIVNVAAFQLARRKWPGEGLKMPGGVLIPTIAIVACLAQFRSLAWPQALIGLGLVAGGLLIYRSRHRQELGEDAAARAREAVEEQDTPLLRAARSADSPRL